MGRGGNAARGTRRVGIGGFVCPEDAAPSIGTPVQLLGQYGIRLAILAKTTTGPITGRLYAAQKFGTAQPHCRFPLFSYVPSNLAWSVQSHSFLFCNTSSAEKPVD